MSEETAGSEWVDAVAPSGSYIRVTGDGTVWWVRYRDEVPLSDWVTL